MSVSPIKSVVLDVLVGPSILAFLADLDYGEHPVLVELRGAAVELAALELGVEELADLVHEPVAVAFGEVGHGDGW